MRVISSVRWHGELEPGGVPNGIQAHQEMFTTLASAAGIEDVAAEVMVSSSVRCNIDDR